MDPDLQRNRQEQTRSSTRTIFSQQEEQTCEKNGRCTRYGSVPNISNWDAVRSRISSTTTITEQERPINPKTLLIHRSTEARRSSNSKMEIWIQRFKGTGKNKHDRAQEQDPAYKKYNRVKTTEHVPGPIPPTNILIWDAVRSKISSKATITGQETVINLGKAIEQ